MAFGAKILLISHLCSTNPSPIMPEEKPKRKKLYKKLKNKYRLVILNDSTFEEKFSLRLSPMNLFTIVGLFALLLISTVSVLIIFTPLREYIPGYTDTNLRTNLTGLALKSDSLALELDRKDQFIRNLQIILNGGVPDSTMENESEVPDNKPTAEVKLDLHKSKQDSLLRAFVESEDQYNITTSSADKKADLISNYIFFTPLNGTITATFDIFENHHGVDIVAPENEAIKSTLDGTVIFAGWTSSTGYVIQIQHENNIISSYKHNSVLLKQEGEFVKAGEVIAIIGNSGELTTGPHLHFELWYDGHPIDPEKYILF
jgi:murein DD-endopeptidase MepM/ murein hydrolase activator NlpD